MFGVRPDLPGAAWGGLQVVAVPMMIVTPWISKMTGMPDATARLLRTPPAEVVTSHAWTTAIRREEGSRADRQSSI